MAAPSMFMLRSNRSPSFISIRRTTLKSARERTSEWSGFFSNTRKNQRMERLFLEHVARWIRPGGVLVMVVPYDRVCDCRTVLTPQFKDKAVYRLTEPEAVAYKQVVVFGVRRTRQERE